MTKFDKGDIAFEVPELGPLTVLGDTEYWGIRMPNGDVYHLTTREQIIREFQVHLNAVSACGLRAEFLRGARIVRHRRLFLATQWEDDVEACELVAELFPLVEAQPEDGDAE